MNENDFKEILELPELNKSAIAAKMYPNNSAVTAKTRLANKIKETIAGSGKQRLTDEDLDKAKIVLKDLADRIYKVISN